ncbi:vitamin-D-receptor interacting mediator subunit 4-domain-containing protein [Kockovaella imperatae]|uniref:Mediator of RNA polymerase II transcription subunit 4 n=1 Tax=Kockovaella imperatae TaxID=4999 RepID=A0A1Y1UMS3_9TREE|nr:vitamin-D-receptor interacting mediator subunit 4-domain-containing protein [Kockovaella imperatae]ORX39350.1 vitamin-D-receptor interacting mediator subunit 4-domain-containing protein [Kockovaella imperatae]
MTYPLSTTQPDPDVSNQAVNAPPREQLLSNLSLQSILLTQLFAIISNPPTQAPGTAQSHPVAGLYRAIDTATNDLGGIVKEVRIHQQAWARLERVKDQVKALDMDVRRVIGDLERGRVELEGMVNEGIKVREAIDRVSKDPLPVQPLLAHARSLARHSSAPVSSLLAPIDKAQYQPWPTETAMRAGILFREGGSMSGIGDVGIVGEERPQEAVQMMEEDYMQQEESRRPAPAVFSLDLNSDSDDD